MVMILWGILRMLRDYIPDSLQSGWVEPRDRHTYYVYVLRKPDGCPFYVGKGRNSRVNSHFTPHSLREDSLKNRAILKHGVENCYREIVAYCDEESDAYELERFLMAEIGCLLDKTGPLTNVDIPITGAYRYKKSGEKVRAAPKCKYSEATVFRFYVMEFELCLPRGVITDALGIERNYQLNLARGTARRDLFSKYVTSGLVVNNRKDLDHVPRIPQANNVELDHRLREEYNHVINGRKTLKEAAESVGMYYNHVINIFSGRARKHMGFDYRRDLKVPLKGNSRVHDRDKALDLIKSGVGVGEFIKIMNCSREYYYYVRDLFREYGVIDGGT